MIQKGKGTKMRIPIDQIKPSPFSARPKEPDVASLTESIKEHGELQPIKVRPLGEAYECVFGHRRLVAARQAGLSNIDCIVEELDDRQARLQMWEENERREDLDDISRAKFIKQFKEDYGLGGTHTSMSLGISESHLYLLLSLLDEPSEVQQRVATREVSTRTVHHLRSIIPDREERTAVLLEAAEREESSRETIRRAREMKVEAETEEIVVKIHAHQEEERERAWWNEHPTTKEFLEMLKRHIRLLNRGHKSIVREKIPSEHCNYLAEFMETKIRRLHEEVIADLREKAEKWQ